MTIEELRNNGWIAYEYVRGSHMYHLNVETSDKDIGGVFICPPEYILGLRDKYENIEQVSDAKSDTVFYEFGRWIELLLKSNPSALESLFAPKDCIIGEVHPAVQYVLDHKEMFLSKECFKTFYGYAVSQISKCRGLNKKIVNPMTERKDVLDFCHVFYGQGSIPMKEWLKNNGFKQEYCGLVNIPNMNDAYSVFYDWGNHYIHEKGSDFYEQFWNFGNKGTAVPQAIGYRGIVAREGDESNEVRLSSVEKGAQPICHMQFSKDAYAQHCKAYREYKDWEKKRNPARYESNLDKNYDSKNVMHCMRLIRMAKELALGQGFNLVRTEDREYLLDIRRHKYEYDEVIAQLEKEKAEMEEAIKTCTLPEKPNYDEINKLLIEARKKVYNY